MHGPGRLAASLWLSKRFREGKRGALALDFAGASAQQG